MENTMAIARYENLLLHKTNRFYLTGTPDEKEKSALAVLRYIIRDLLNWSPSEAMVGLNNHVVKQMHIDVLLTYVRLPVDIMPDEDYDYLVHMAFPNETKYKPEDKIIRNYLAVLKGAKDRFPKNYFNRVMGGRIRARCILVYAIDRNVIVKGRPDIALYKLFADKEQITDLLREWKLNNVCKTLYDGEPLAFLHDTYAKSASSDFLYNNYMFKKLFEEASKKVK